MITLATVRTKHTILNVHDKASTRQADLCAIPKVGLDGDADGHVNVVRHRDAVPGLQLILG